MAIVYRKSDRLRVKIKDIEVALAPLSFAEKAEIQDLLAKGKFASAAVQAVAMCLKDVKGVKTIDGEDYKLEFENDKLKEQCLDDLLNLNSGPEMTLVCLNMLSNVPDEFIDNNTGKKLEGVEIIKSEKKKEKK